MTLIEIELQQLKKEILNMWQLISKQLTKAITVLVELDLSIAEEILANEKRVNLMEVEIDRRCEDVFALYNPVAIDLRLVLALLKINSSLERIGDVAASVARYARKPQGAETPSLIKSTQALIMFEEANALVRDVMHAFEKEDTALAESIFHRDRALNEYFKNAKAVIIEYIKQNPQTVENCLNILSIIRKLERAGDQSKSIAHEIIFYIEAKVSKHQGKGEGD
jgi:phosphate transport system protein